MEIESSDDPLKIKLELDEMDDDEEKEITSKPQRIRKKVIKVDLTQDCFEEEGIDPLGLEQSSDAGRKEPTQSTTKIAIKKEPKSTKIKDPPKTDELLNPTITVKEEELDDNISSDDEFKFEDNRDFDDQDFKPEPEELSSDEEFREPKPEIPFTCKTCGKGFQKKTPHKMHVRRCFKTNDMDPGDSSSEEDKSKKTPKVYRCEKCKRKFQVRFYYKKHIAKCATVKEETDEKPPPKCTFCFKTMANDQGLRKHIKEIHSTEELLWPCPSCPKKFYIERDLVLHKVVHEVKRICELCGKNYSSSKALKRHIETHSEVKHICELCGLALKTSHSLQNHMFSHTEYFRYTCHYCGKGFRRSNSIKLHLMIHQGLKPYKCRFCDKTFTDSAVSRSHMKSSHIELHRKAVERNNGRPIGAIILYRIPTLKELDDKAKAEGTPLQEVGPYRGEEKWQEKMFGCKTNE